MAYFLSPALAQLRAEVNALWPGRDKTSDGWIGDAAHSARTSDHNPDANGSVNAIDLDKDGLDPMAVVRAAVGDRRCSYVIFAGTIWRARGEWRAEPYTGANGHYGHVHVSIWHGDTYEQDRSSWGVAAAVSNTTPTTPGTVPTVPDVTAPDPLEEVDDMFTDADRAALGEIHGNAYRARRNAEETLALVREQQDTLARIEDNAYRARRNAEETLRAVGGLTTNAGPVDVAAIADAVNDEADQRARDRLG